MSGQDIKTSLSEEEMQQVYAWVDEIPLTRPKRNIARDFSDGVMTAELVKHFFPKLVELHNYSTANSVTHKLYNWNTLNQKVFKKLNFTLTRADIDGVCNCTTGAIERVLYLLKTRIEARVQRKANKQGASPDRPPPVHSSSSQHTLSMAPLPSMLPQYAPSIPQPNLSPPPQQQLNKGGNVSQPPNVQHLSPILTTKAQHNKQQNPSSSYPPPLASSNQQPTTNAPYNYSTNNHLPPHQQGSPQQQHQQQQQQQPPYNPVFYDNSRSGGGINDPQVILLLEKKDQTINELHAHVENLESRLMKLEQIVRIRDSKIQKLTARLQQAGLA